MTFPPPSRPSPLKGEGVQFLNCVLASRDLCSHRRPWPDGFAFAGRLITLKRAVFRGLRGTGMSKGGTCLGVRLLDSSASRSRWRSRGRSFGSPLTPGGCTLPWRRWRGSLPGSFGNAVRQCGCLADNPGIAAAGGAADGRTDPGQEAERRIADTKPRRALRDSEALYHSLVDHLPLSVLRKDRDGKYTFVNRRYLEFSKKEAGEIIGTTDFDIFPHELAAKYRAG